MEKVKQQDNYLDDEYFSEEDEESQKLEIKNANSEKKITKS